MNSKVVIAPERFLSDSARDRSANPCGPRSLFFSRQFPLGAPCVLTRGDLRTVMTSEQCQLSNPAPWSTNYGSEIERWRRVCGTRALRAKSF
jgi:hypothetical protein